MVINTNISAMFSSRLLDINNENLDKDIQKLSSGRRINTAVDDPTGLAISEKMKSQILGLNQASKNAGDGISLIQTAEGYLSETENLLQRIRVLSVQSANGIYTSDDRQQSQVEVSQLIDEISRIGSMAEFNKLHLLNGHFASSNNTQSQAGVEGTSNGDNGEALIFHVGANVDQRIKN